MTPNVEAAPPRNLTRELQQTYQGYRDTAPGYYNLERKYQPLYGQLALGNQAQNLTGYTDKWGTHQPGQAELARYASTYQRAGNVSDALNMGPAASAALLRANPYLNSSLNSLSKRTVDTPLLQTLNRQANEGLASGGQLSSQDIRNLNEQSRSGFAARGNLYGNQSLGADLLSRDAAVRQRMAAAQQFAGNVQGMNQNQNDFVGRASQIFGTQLNPLAVLGLAGGGGGGGSGAGGGQMIGSGAQLFNPTNPYAQDIYNTNYNAQSAANIANANNAAARNSAYIQAAGAIAGGLLSDVRLKKRIKTVGETPSGIPVKTWTYKTDPANRKYVGGMAQDIEKVHPAAVKTDPISGVKTVDYRKTDVPFGVVAGKKKRLDFATGQLVAA